jgi:hypothetical protein
MATTLSTHAQINPGGLVLWNTMGSQMEIENSEKGLNGAFNGGRFVEGMFGNAYMADHGQSGLVTFPKEVVPVDSGCIEFWAKLIDFPCTLAEDKNPAFIHLSDGYTSFFIGLCGNDGAGYGGLCGSAGHGFHAGTGSAGSWTYKQVFGSNPVEKWHHYALVWSKSGIPGVFDGTKKVAVFLDGQLDSARWHHDVNSKFVPLKGGSLGLIHIQHLSQGSVAIDNLRIWNYAKTDFCDRFLESPESTSVDSAFRVALFKSHVVGDYCLLQIDQSRRCDFVQFQRTIRQFRSGYVAPGVLDNLITLLSGDEFNRLESKYDVYPLDPAAPPIEYEDTYYWLDVTRSGQTKRVLTHEHAAPEKLKQIISTLISLGRELPQQPQDGLFLLVAEPEIIGNVRWLKSPKDLPVEFDDKTLSMYPTLKKAVLTSGWLYRIPSLEVAGIQGFFVGDVTRFEFIYHGKKLAACLLRHGKR